MLVSLIVIIWACVHKSVVVHWLNSLVIARISLIIINCRINCLRTSDQIQTLFVNFLWKVVWSLYDWNLLIFLTHINIAFTNVFLHYITDIILHPKWCPFIVYELIVIIPIWFCTIECILFLQITHLHQLLLRFKSFNAKDFLSLIQLKLIKTSDLILHLLKFKDLYHSFNLHLPLMIKFIHIFICLNFLILLLLHYL